MTERIPSRRTALSPVELTYTRLPALLFAGKRPSAASFYRSLAETGPALAAAS